MDCEWLYDGTMMQEDGIVTDARQQTPDPIVAGAR